MYVVLVEVHLGHGSPKWLNFAQSCHKDLRGHLVDHVEGQNAEAAEGADTAASTGPEKIKVVGSISDSF
jgi:hypothetical protein